MENNKSVTNHMVSGSKLYKDKDGKFVISTTYKQMIGSLMYLTAGRPNLMYAVCLVSRYMERPTKVHMVAVKRTLRYVKGTTSLGILYRRRDNRNHSEEQLIGYSESDYAGHIDDRKSTPGYVYMLGSGVVSWSSKKQPMVTLSTT